MFKKILAFMAITAIISAPFTATPKPAQALTFEEGVRLWGVLNRYLEDLQKTFPTHVNTTPPTNPQIPDVPTPGGSEEIPLETLE
jgi:hypothetical protein